MGKDPPLQKFLDSKLLPGTITMVLKNPNPFKMP